MRIVAPPGRSVIRCPIPSPAVASLESASPWAGPGTRPRMDVAVRALALVPKSTRALLKTELQQAKTQPSVAQHC